VGLVLVEMLLGLEQAGVHLAEVAPMFAVVSLNVLDYDVAIVKL
jgi:hypothetical protein